MRKHYYNLSFIGDQAKSRSAVVALNFEMVTVPDVLTARESLEMDENAALLSISYLGHMTENEYIYGVPPLARWRPWLKAVACVMPFVILGLLVRYWG